MVQAYEDVVLNHSPPALFTCKEHFSQPVLAVLRTAARDFSAELFTKTALAGIRLKDWDGLADEDGVDGRLRDVERVCCVQPSYEVMLDHITDVILGRPAGDFLPAPKGLRLVGGNESVVSCVIDASNYLEMLEGKVKVQFLHMLDNSSSFMPNTFFSAASSNNFTLT